MPLSGKGRPLVPVVVVVVAVVVVGVAVRVRAEMAIVGGTPPPPT